MAEYLTPVVQKLDADISAWMAKIETVKRELAGLENSTSKTTDKVKDDVDEAGDSFEKMGKKAKKSGDDVDESMKHSKDSVSDFDRLVTANMKRDGKAFEDLTKAIGTTQTKVKNLRETFAKTGDEGIFNDLKAAEANLKMMVEYADRMKSGYRDTFNSMDRDSGSVLTRMLRRFQAVFKFFGDHSGKILIGALIAVSPLIGATLNGAIMAGLGLGGIAAGIVIAMKDPRIAASFAALKHQLGSVFKDSAASFLGPVQAGLSDIQSMLAQAAPGLRAMFSGLSHEVQPLIDGFGGFITDMLPGLEEGMAAALPILAILAAKLPWLGAQIGNMFKLFDQGSNGAKLGILTLITVLGGAFNAIGYIVRSLSWAFEYVAQETVHVTNGIADLLVGIGHIPGLGKFKTWGQDMHNAAHGLQDTIDKTEATTVAVGAAGLAFDSTGIDIKGMANDLKGLIDTQNQYLDLLQANDNSLLAMDQALTAWQKQLKTGKHNWDEMTEAGQANVEQLNNATQHISDYYRNLAKLHPLTKAQTQAELAATSQLYNQAKAAGATTDELATLLTQVNDLKDQLNLLKSKDITIKINQHFISTGAADPAAFYHGLASGGVVKAAQGLVSGVLKPSNPGTLVLAGEPGTHGEVFMPLSGIDQGRAMKLAQVAGDAYNFQVVPRESRSAGLMLGGGGGGGGTVYMQPIQVLLGGKQMAMIHAALITPSQQYKSRTGTTGLN